MTWDPVLKSSNSNEWGTPPDLFDFFNKRFNFDLDAAAGAHNATVKNYFSKDKCAFSHEWNRHGSRVWLNPPYGRRCGLWIERAHDQAKRGKIRVVVLVMARTDTAAFHDHIMKAQELYFVRGRLKFTREDGHTGPAPCGSVVAVFDGRWETRAPQIKTLEKNAKNEWEINHH